MLSQMTVTGNRLDLSDCGHILLLPAGPAIILAEAQLMTIFSKPYCKAAEQTEFFLINKNTLSEV